MSPSTYVNFLFSPKASRGGAQNFSEPLSIYDDLHFVHGFSVEEDLGIFSSAQTYIEKRARNFFKSQRSSEFVQSPLSHIFFHISHIFSKSQSLYTYKRELRNFPSPKAYL